MKNNNLSENYEEDIFTDENEELEQENGMFEHFRFEVDKGQALLRIDKYLTAHLEGTSRHRVQQAIDAEYVRVNGNLVKANYKIKPCDLITIHLPYRRRGLEIKPEKMDLDIRYEDDDLMVINKPAGLVVHPGHGNYTGTLLNGLSYYLGISQGPDAKDERMGVLVHRIDKDTSGTLLIAKNEDSQLFLAKQFFVHSIERKYIAIVWGDIQEDSGTIIGNIGRDPNDRLKFKVFEDGSCGKHAVTHYRVIERLGYVTVVECQLETGRTHQIRVHMNHIGHPLFNDQRYGGDRILKGTLYTKYKQFIDNCFELLPRQALHAKTIGFVHPTTRKTIVVESELPDDMVSVIDKFRTLLKSRNQTI
ncbi:MAG: RluA family pseudouridine synthase [Bacteroidales bacterium]|nr:RluA family pseudouridine synthase [Bacteroidales bacterium]